MDKSDRLSAIAEGISFFLLACAFVAIQVIIGGTRMVFSLPSYGILGLVGLLGVVSLRRAKPLPNESCLVITAIFLGYVLLRAWFSPVPYIAQSDFYSVLAGLLVYFFTACIFTGTQQRMIFICGLLVLALVHVFIGAWQFRDGTNFMPISWLQRADYGRRASGFYVCPNHLAGLLEVLGVFGLSIVCWSRWPGWARMLVGYATIACYAGSILTGSRGGYLSAGFSLAVFGVLSLVILGATSTKLFWKIGGAGLLAAVIFGAVVYFAVSKSPYLSNRAENTFETTNMRVDLWKGAIQEWKLRPIFGTGSGTYLYYGRLFRTDRVQLDPIYTHNDYLNLLAEYGLVGALGMVIFLGIHLRRAGWAFLQLGPRRVAVSQRMLSNTLALNVGALAAVASYLAHSVVDFNLHIPANLLLMAFVFGMLANEGAVREVNPPAPASAETVWRLVLPLLGLILVVQSIRLLPGEYYSERSRASLRDWKPGSGLRYALAGLQHEPKNPDLHYRLGVARLQMASLTQAPEAAAASFRSEAVEALERAHAMVPQEEIYARELASALDDSGRFQEAEAVFDSALRWDPKSVSLRRQYEHHLQLWRGPMGAKDSIKEES